MRMIVAALLVVSAALFAVGVTIERGGAASHVEPTPTPQRTTAAPPYSPAAAKPTIAPHNESGESAAHVAAEHAGRSPRASVAPAGTPEPVHTEGGGETAGHRKAELAQQVLGINAEATGTVIAVLVASALLALLIALRSNAIVLLLVAAFVAASAVFDGAEVAHQLTEHRTSLVAIAGVVLLLHVGAAIASLVLLRRRPTPA
jgi:hypothetical protein